MPNERDEVVELLERRALTRNDVLDAAGALAREVAAVAPKRDHKRLLHRIEGAAAGTIVWLLHASEISHSALGVLTELSEYSPSSMNGAIPPVDIRHALRFMGDVPATPSDLWFGDFRISLVEHRLYRGTTTIRLRPKAWELLLVLIDRPDALFTFEQLNRALWPDTVVAPHALTKLMSDLRRALGDEGASFIENVPRRGYRFRRPEGPRQDTPPSSPPTSPAPEGIVGRDEELHRLDNAWRTTRGGQRQFVFVGGEPGIGKSTLIDTFVRRAIESVDGGGRPLLLHAQCVPLQTEPAPYGPMVEALRRAAREPVVRASLGRSAPAWLLQMPELLDGSEARDLVAMVGQSGPQRMLNEAAALLDTLARERPVVLVVEDAHWADTATTDLLRTLLSLRSDAALLGLVSYRTAEVALGRHPMHALLHAVDRSDNAQRLVLGAFAASAIKGFLATRFARASEPSLVEMLERVTAGNPLFLSLMLEHLISLGWITADDGRWRREVPSQLERLGMPTSLRDMIEVELRALAPSQIDTLEAAALVGDRFTADAVAAATGAAEAAIDEDLFALARARHIVAHVDEGEPAYQFVHVLYRQGLAERIPPGRARHLHQQLGEDLERRLAHNPLPEAPRLAHHFQAAGDRSRTALYLELAARHALLRFAHREAADFLRRAITAIRALPESRERSRREAARLLDLANLAMSVDGGARSEARAAYEQSLALAETAGDADLRIRALLGRCLEAALRDSDEARVLVEERLAPVAHECPDLAAVVGVYHALVCFFQGDWAQAWEQTEGARHALAEARPGIPVHFDLQVRLDVYRSTVLSALGKDAAATESHAAAVTRAERHNRPFETVDALLWRAHDLLLRDDPVPAVQVTERVIALGSTHGVPHWVEVAQALRALGLARQGEASLDDLDAATAVTRHSKDRWVGELVGILLADELRRRGHVRQAWALIEATPLRSRRYLEPVRLRIQGVILLEDPALAIGLDAVDCLHRAVRLADQRCATIFAARARQTLAARGLTEPHR